MPRRDAFHDTAYVSGGRAPLRGARSDPDPRLSLVRLERLVELRDTQRGQVSRDQELLINRAIHSVFRDCDSLGFTREACSVLERRTQPGLPD